MRVAAFGLVALLLLAGCSSKGNQDEQAPPADFSDLDLAATSTTGVIRGVVVDDAIRPIAGATVTLRGEPPQAAQTRDDGAFGFDDLPGGTYFLSVHKPGFLDAQQSTDVAVGVAEPPIVKVQLRPDAAFVQPFAETYVFDGFMECSAGGLFLGSYGILNACSTEVPTVGKPFTNDNTLATYQVTGAPDWAQAEMVWTSTQAVSHAMSLSFSIPTDNLAAHQDGWDDRSVEGPSPLVNTMDAETTQAYLDNGTMVLRIFPWADQDPGPIVAVEQRFTVYTTLFYGYTPPEGWTFGADGTVPPPPQ